MSKKYVTTIQAPIYVVEYFKLTKDFIIKRKNSLEDIESITHTGSYKKLWQFEVNKQAELNSFLRRWYPKDKSVGFYTHLNFALKDNRVFNYILIIRPIEKNDLEWKSYILKPKKIKNPHLKSKRRYYCGCFLCVGTEKEAYHRKKMKEEKLLCQE